MSEKCLVLRVKVFSIKSGRRCWIGAVFKQCGGVWFRRSVEDNVWRYSFCDVAFFIMTHMHGIAIYS